MSLDIKYRPVSFRDVVGQADNCAMLKRLVLDGKACRQSYIFGGLSGTGKTTTARILARAILCPALTPEGEPCNQCPSCRDILERGDSAAFTEVDAANNSGKAHIQQILESLTHSSFGSAHRKIYLIDEAHRLSTDAMDALLKPMEETIPGSQDRRLVCLFCTTELEKMRTAIRSRSMTFRITEPTEEDLVERLRWVCGEEGFKCEEDEALKLIVEQGRGHVRDMLHALERTAQLASGEISRSTVEKALGLQQVPLYYKTVAASGRGDHAEARLLLKDLLRQQPPAQVEEALMGALLDSYARAVFGEDFRSVRVGPALVAEVLESWGVTAGDSRSASSLMAGADFLRSRLSSSGPGGAFLTGDGLQCDVFRLGSRDWSTPVLAQEARAASAAPSATLPQTSAPASTRQDWSPNKVRADDPSQLPPKLRPFVNPNQSQTSSLGTGGSNPGAVKPAPSEPLPPGVVPLSVKRSVSEDGDLFLKHMRQAGWSQE
jgi:DNA polymerase III subunit gamma/tau